MEKIKYMFMAVLVALVSMTVTSCGDDDDDENVSNQKNPASMIVGTYAGTLRQPGDNTGAPCYVAFERLSNTTVMLTRFICEKYGIDIKNVNFTISESNGIYKLNPESNLVVDGMYINGVLTMTFQTEGDDTWIFNGRKCI